MVIGMVAIIKLLNTKNAFLIPSATYIQDPNEGPAMKPTPVMTSFNPLIFPRSSGKTSTAVAYAAGSKMEVQLS